MKKSTILQQSKQFLGTERWDGVCSALDIWQNKKDKQNKHVKQTYAIMDDISEILGQFAFAHRWLAWEMTKPKPNSVYIASKHWNTASEWLDNQSIASIQQWRLQWMDQLITYYKSKGE